MATVEDLGKKMKEKFPGQYDDLSDIDLGRKAKQKYPQYADFADVSDKKTPLFGLAKKAASRKLGIEVGEHAATMESEIGTAKGKAWGDIGKGAVLGGATLLTGGLAAPAAMGLMGAAGVGAATLDETLKAHFGSEEIPKSAGALAAHLGLEGALSAAGEGGARALGQGIKYLGKEAFPSLVMRSAAKAEQGQNVLKRVQQDTFDQLRDFSRTKGNPQIDIGDDLGEFYKRLGKRATGTSSSFDEAMKPVYAKLGKSGQGVLSHQPLADLMEIKSDLSHVTYKVAGMNTDEFVALERLTGAIDSKIEAKLASLGGSAAAKLYRDYKAFTSQIRSDNALAALAEGGIKKLLGKGVGYIPTADVAIDTLVRGKAAPWLLERLFSNGKTAAMVGKAMRLEAVGQRGAAQSAFDAAVNASDVGSLLKDWMKPEKREVAGNAMLPQPDVGP